MDVGGPHRPPPSGSEISTAAAPLAARRPRVVRRTSRPRRGENDAVGFSDLVCAHWHWERARYAGEPAARLEREYRHALAAFEARFGPIAEAYWSIRDASAVALTIGRKRSLAHPRGEPIPRFHRATEWATRDEPSIAQALNECATLAIKVTEVLRGSAELIALRRILGVASQLLGFVDRSRGRPGEDEIILARAVGVGGSVQAEHVVRSSAERRHAHAAAHFAAGQRKELAKVEVFYDRAGNKQARIVYFCGMVFGYFYLLPLAAAAAALIWAVDGLDGARAHWLQLQLLLACLAAGPLGALLSVLTRIASRTAKFEIDYEVGRKQVRWLGIYRPLLGAIFGVATYLLLASGLLQTKAPADGVEVAYYGGLAFLAGFFERFLKVAPGGAPAPLELEEAAKENATPLEPPTRAPAASRVSNGRA
jgi:hypothetical protein